VFLTGENKRGEAVVTASPCFTLNFSLKILYKIYFKACDQKNRLCMVNLTTVYKREQQKYHETTILILIPVQINLMLTRCKWCHNYQIQTCNDTAMSDTMSSFTINTINALDWKKNN